MADVKKLLIGGAWVEGIGAKENRDWAARSPECRKEVLARAADIGRLLAREEDKTLAEATGEALRAAQVFHFFAAEAVRLSGEKGVSIRPGVEVEVAREPLGVIGLITPWNFPIAIPAWKTAPALAAGNAVVLIPAELTPGCAHILAEILVEAGVPAGVFNLVMGSGSVIGNALVRHPDVAAISFTGSEPVGRSIAVGYAEAMKKVQLEMGGKNPMVVLDDADLDTAVAACLNGVFLHRSAVHRVVASDRSRRHPRCVCERAGCRTPRVGRGRSAGRRHPDPAGRFGTTQIGPVVSERQLSANLRYVDLATEEGCAVHGGQRMDADGYFQAPALFWAQQTPCAAAAKKSLAPAPVSFAWRISTKRWPPPMTPTSG